MSGLFWHFLDGRSAEWRADLCALPLHLVHGAGRRLFFPRPLALRLALPFPCDAAPGEQKES